MSKETELTGGQSIQEQYAEMGRLKAQSKKMSTKIKTHLKKHKEAYIVGGVVGVVALSTGAYLGNKGIVNVQLFNSGTVNQQLHIDKSINILTRRGHAGNVVKCVETGEVFASQNRASIVYDIAPSELSKHLRGLSGDVNGLHFEKLDTFNKEVS